MGFDLEQIFCNPPSSSSSTVGTFFNDNYNTCSPCRCHACCRKPFLNDHTYPILKRVCYKIIKSYNRQQCREKYTVFDGGNSINGRWSIKQKDGSEFKSFQRVFDPVHGNEPNRSVNNKKGYQSEENDTLNTSYKKKGQPDKDKMKSAGKTEEEKMRSDYKDDAAKQKKGRAEKNQSDNTRGKTNIDESEPLKKAKKSVSEKKDNVNDESSKLGKGKGRGDESRNDKNNSGVSEPVAIKGKPNKTEKEKGGAITNKRGKETLLDEIIVSETPKKGKKLKNAGSEKEEPPKKKADRKSEMEINKLGRKSKNQTEPDILKGDTKAAGPSKYTDRKSNKEKSMKKKNGKYAGSISREMDKSRVGTGINGSKFINPIKGDTNAAGSRKHNNRKSNREKSIKNKKGKYAGLISREIGSSRVGTGINGSKFIQVERKSNTKDVYSRKLSRGDEIRTCDILRVHLEARDLSRCAPCHLNQTNACQRCMPVCTPCAALVC